MSTHRFTVAAGGDPFLIPLPFDPKTAWGRTRAPVLVEVNGHTYRSTVTTMGGTFSIPFRRSHREAARIVEGDPVEVTVALDTAPRTVDTPDDLRAALEAAGAWAAWQRLRYTRRREDVEAVEGASKPETRARRIATCVAAVSR